MQALCGNGIGGTALMCGAWNKLPADEESIPLRPRTSGDPAGRPRPRNNAQFRCGCPE